MLQKVLIWSAFSNYTRSKDYIAVNTTEEVQVHRKLSPIFKGKKRKTTPGFKIDEAKKGKKTASSHSINLAGVETLLSPPP